MKRRKEEELNDPTVLTWKGGNNSLLAFCLYLSLVV